MRLSGWGNFPSHETRIIEPGNLPDLVKAISLGQVIARGNGRSYGDSAISQHNTLSMKQFDKIVTFNERQGQLVVEAGVLLSDIINAFLPRGWFPAVTPGTKYVTIGGMIAADVHGKNHHKEGSFRNFVDWIDLIEANGKTQRCSLKQNKELFEWTIGGMGLTGVIVRAAIRLRPVETSWMKQRTIPTANLDETIDLFEESAAVDYSAAWLDCLSSGDRLGRSLVILGEHAALDDLEESKRSNPLKAVNRRRLSVPFNFPKWFLNRATVSAFNNLYYWMGQRNRGETLIDMDSYFYPLDAVSDWNKIYGKGSLAQFQCVLPLQKSRKGLRDLLMTVSGSKQGSFLSVLKRFGKQEGGLSFPMEGYTLAMDFPANKKTFALMQVLDDITLAHGGRFYLAKDARMRQSTLHKSDQRVKAYAQMRRQGNMHLAFQSAQSERLGL